jgi:hypothetical protein
MHLSLALLLCLKHLKTEQKKCDDRFVAFGARHRTPRFVVSVLEKYPKSLTRCVLFRQRPQTISLFDAAARLTRIKQKIEHVRALTRGAYHGRPQLSCVARIVGPKRQFGPKPGCAL